MIDVEPGFRKQEGDIGSEEGSDEAAEIDQGKAGVFLCLAAPVNDADADADHHHGEVNG